VVSPCGRSGFLIQLLLCYRLRRCYECAFLLIAPVIVLNDSLGVLVSAAHLLGRRFVQKPLNFRFADSDNIFADANRLEFALFNPLLDC
jgi:hypothetical protein